MFTGISTVFEVHRRHHLKTSIPRLGPFLEHQPISATSRTPRATGTLGWSGCLMARRPTVELPEHSVETTVYTHHLFTSQPR